MAALSPETQVAFDEIMELGWTKKEAPTYAFQAIGSALAHRRTPVSSANQAKIFAFADQLLRHGSGEVMNAVATCMLETIWSAAQGSGFDFTFVDEHLGPNVRGYLIAWDDFNNTKTKGLTRR